MTTVRLIGMGCLTAVLVLAALELVSEAALVAYWKVRGGPEAETATEALFFLGRGDGPPPPVAELGPGIRYIGAISSTHFRSARNAAGERWREWEPADPILGWRYAPSAAVVQFIPAGPVLARYVTTPQGFISPDWTGPVYAIPKPDGVFRVVVLGGSTVAGVGTENPAETLPAQLERLLGVEGRRVEVINAGVSGHDAARELLYLVTELVAYGPDLVIAYDGWNEVPLNDRLRGPGDERAVFRPMADAGDRLQASYSVSGSAWLLARAAGTWLGFHFANGQSGLVEIAGAARRALFGSAPPPPPPAARVYEGMPRLYRATHESMIALSKVHGFRIAVFLQPLLGMGDKPLTAAEADNLRQARPDRLEIRRALFRDFGAEMEAMGAAHAGEPGVCLGDLRHAFAEVTERVYVDTGHLNAAGNRIMAGVIAARLRACHLVDRVAATSP